MFNHLRYNNFLLLSLSVYLCDVAVIGGERIAQMTKTYNDIEAVTKLLEEASELLQSLTKNVHTVAKMWLHYF